MEFTVKTPMHVDKIAGFFKSAFSFISKAARTAGGFIKVHSPLICLVAGTLLCVGGFVTAYIWRRKQGKQEVSDPDEYSKSKKKRFWQNFASIGMFVAGSALQVASYIISAGRINALSKALAAALNAGSVLGIAKMSNETTPEEEEKLNIARNTFSLKIDELPCYQDWNGYHSCEILNNVLSTVKRRVDLGEHITWNEILRQLNISDKKTPWGYNIGWTKPGTFEWVITDGWGNEVDKHTMVWSSVTGNLKGYRVYFLGMENNSYFDPERKKFVRAVVEGEE